MEVNLLYLSAFVAILAALYHLLTKNNGYFHEKPIPSLVVKPLLGSVGDMIFQRVPIGEFVQTIYNKFPNVK